MFHYPPQRFKSRRCEVRRLGGPVNGWSILGWGSVLMKQELLFVFHSRVKVHSQHSQVLNHSYSTVLPTGWPLILIKNDVGILSGAMNTTVPTGVSNLNVSSSIGVDFFGILRKQDSAQMSEKSLIADSKKNSLYYIFHIATGNTHRNCLLEGGLKL